MMKFIKTNNKIVSMFTKQEAIKELRRDRRVAKIVSHPDIYQYRNKVGFTIYTNYIIPTLYEDWFETIKGPIGKFKITVVDLEDEEREDESRESHSLEVVITRVGGRISVPGDDPIAHPHVPDPGEIRGVCWGSFRTNANKLQDNKDWYYLALQSLNLLECVNDDYGDYDSIHMFAMVYAMRRACIRSLSGKNKLKRQARKAIKGDDELLDSYNNGWYCGSNYFVGGL
jgi:hypothetical protein